MRAEQTTVHVESGRSGRGHVRRPSASGMSGIAIGGFAGAAIAGPLGAAVGMVLGGAAGEVIERRFPSAESDAAKSRV